MIGGRSFHLAKAPFPNGSDRRVVAKRRVAADEPGAGKTRTLLGLDHLEDPQGDSEAQVCRVALTAG